jgi:hypothetical protein
VRWDTSTGELTHGWWLGFVVGDNQVTERGGGEIERPCGQGGHFEAQSVAEGGTLGSGVRVRQIFGLVFHRPTNTF